LEEFKTALFLYTVYVYVTVLELVPPVQDKLTVPPIVEVATGVPKALIATNVVIVPKEIDDVVV
jgi:hypothetical protein